MPELIAMTIVGFIAGVLAGTAVAWPIAWREGCDWARKEIFGG